MSALLGTSERLTVRTLPAPGPVDLVAALPHPAALAWIRHDSGLVGWGEAARVPIPGGPDRFARARAALAALFADAEVDDAVGVPGSGPVAFGAFGFDPAGQDSVLIVPRAVVGWRDGRAWHTVIGDDADPRAALNPPRPPSGVSWRGGALGDAAWADAVRTATARIRQGELGKVVLARDLWAEADEPIDPRVLLRRLSARFPDCYTFAVDGLVGATPELLVRRIGGEIASLVLAGTTPRGADEAADRALGEALFASAKDRHEHAYAADMVRDALAPMCAELEVPAEPELLRLANVQHLATPVRGRLAGERSVLDVLEALHPTPAVCGTPTAAAMDLIGELEEMDRSRYAGPVGWVDSRGDGEWGIALRCAQLDGRRARLFAGCGIVADSDPAAEIAEARAKFGVMRAALDG
ncbi:isochorismate synthase [Actinocorallia sp. A-T 12471]|uniref:isochorismate synthase n=1 Tax=Actinocorallia sp. A-T 12471 TaxID=3089813 RepID=UPI0029CB7260|nr:isochorismate synthase [Actinocorallia sp. A-T 12471]MDX6741242.1 isochorismate synthase [Actinocorallia sp. A-T 12471]